LAVCFVQEGFMTPKQVFDYDQPTRDSLAGIYVEASDEALEQAGGVDTSAGRSVPQPAALFGLTLTADDSANAKQSNARPASPGSAFPG
jgi:hypothetical protein